MEQKSIPFILNIMKSRVINPEFLKEINTDRGYKTLVVLFEGSYIFIKLFEGYLTPLSYNRSEFFIIENRSNSNELIINIVESSDKLYNFSVKKDIEEVKKNISESLLKYKKYYKYFYSDFDKVLFRTDDTDKWKPGFLVDIIEMDNTVYFESSNGLLYNQCIGYDELYSHTTKSPNRDFYITSYNNRISIGVCIYNNIFFNGEFYIPNKISKLEDEITDTYNITYKTLSINDSDKNKLKNILTNIEENGIV